MDQQRVVGGAASRSAFCRGRGRTAFARSVGGRLPHWPDALGHASCARAAVRQARVRSWLNAPGSHFVGLFIGRGRVAAQYRYAICRPVVSQPDVPRYRFLLALRVTRLVMGGALPRCSTSRAALGVPRGYDNVHLGPCAGRDLRLSCVTWAPFAQPSPRNAGRAQGTQLSYLSRGQVRPQSCTLHGNGHDSCNVTRGSCRSCTGVMPAVAFQTPCTTPALLHSLRCAATSRPPP